MLDFNQCRDIQPTDKGIETAVQAFFINDPYFPRPLTSNPGGQKLWKKFKEEYLQIGKQAIEHSQKEPKQWKGQLDMIQPERSIKAGVEEERKRMKRQAKATERLKGLSYA